MRKAINKIIKNVKESIFLKLYMIILFLANSIYLYFEISKFEFIKDSGLDSSGIIENNGQLNALERIINFSNITSFLESVITIVVFIYIIYIIKNIIQRNHVKEDIQNFLFINSISLVTLLLISYLASLFFSLPIGNSLQQLFGPVGLTLMVGVYFIGRFLYEKLLKSK